MVGNVRVESAHYIKGCLNEGRRLCVFLLEEHKDVESLMKNYKKEYFKSLKRIERWCNLSVAREFDFAAFQTQAMGEELGLIAYSSIYADILKEASKFGDFEGIDALLSGALEVSLVNEKRDYKEQRNEDVCSSEGGAGGKVDQIAPSCVSAKELSQR